MHQSNLLYLCLLLSLAWMNSYKNNNIIIVIIILFISHCVYYITLCSQMNSYAPYIIIFMMSAIYVHRCVLHNILYYNAMLYNYITLMHAEGRACMCSWTRDKHHGLSRPSPTVNYVVLSSC